MLHTTRDGAAGGTVTTDSRLMSIGTVLNALRDEFPEVTISKIRFLESEGLIEPQRTPSGYRKFGPDDIERLAHVLRMQRDHYLPLKVIKEQLDALGRGDPLPVPAPGRPGDAGYEEGGGAVPTAARVGRDELLAAVGIDDAELDEWESYGIIAALPDGGYDASAVLVAELVGELGRFGIEPRHLRLMRAAADREAGLIDQVVAPLRVHRNPQTRAHAQARATELAGLTVRLHAALVQTALGVRLP